MLKKIARKVFLEKYPEFIQANYYKDKYIYPKTFNSYILYVEAGSTVGVCNGIARELTKLIGTLNYEKVFLLGDTTTPWLFRKHDYKPVKRALDYLTENKISKSFNGAIEVNTIDLTEFMKNLFWLVRCNGVVFYPHFSDPGFNIMASICQYGNLHFSTLNKDADSAFNEVIMQTGLRISTDDNCGSDRIYKRKATFLPG
jgi:hypothetical protein